MRSVLLHVCATVLAITFGVATAGYAGTVKVTNPVRYAKDTDVREAVRTECQVGEKIATFLSDYSSEVELVKGPAGSSGRVLDLEISEVHAGGGGAFSGPKWVEVRGTLKDSGKRKASFRAKRYSTGGVFGGFKGTCAIVGRCTQALGKDIAGWLKDPHDKAELGDAK